MGIDVKINKRKSLEDYSIEKLYCTEGLYSHYCSIDCIDEEASQKYKMYIVQA